MKSVIFVVPTLIGHGMERMAVYAAEVLKKEYDVTIAVFNSENQQYDTTVNIVNLNVPTTKNTFGKIINVVKRVFRLRKLRKQTNAFAVISFGTSANIVNALSKGTGKTIISFRGYAAVEKGFSFDLTCRLSDWIICVSNCLRDHLFEICPCAKEKTSVIYNRTDLKSIHEKSKETIEFQTRFPMIASVGRLEPVKGHRHLINAFDKVLSQFPTAKLVLIGDGNERSVLEKQTKDLHIEDNVVFLGSQKNPFPYLKACDLCVQTSITEGFINVIVEAGACGVPVISTDCHSGPREILSTKITNEQTCVIEYSDFGVLVPPFTANDSVEPEKEKMLSEAIINLLRDNDLRERYANKLDERTKDFDLNKYYQDYTELLKRW